MAEHKGEDSRTISLLKSAVNHPDFFQIEELYSPHYFENCFILLGHKNHYHYKSLQSINMHTNLIALLALSTLTLAYPTSNYSEPTGPTFNGSVSTLEKRATYGWIASYASSDAYCTGGFDTSNSAPRPKIHGDCIWFVPRDNVIGVSSSTSLHPSSPSHPISPLFRSAH